MPHPASHLLVYGLITMMCVSSHASAAPQAAAQQSQLIESVLTDVAAIRQQVFSFWQQHGPDRVYGGFFGTLDRRGTPVITSAKGLVQTARHVWAFSTFHLHGYQTTGVSNSRPPAAATQPAAALKQQSGGLQQQQQLQQQHQQLQKKQQQQQQQLLSSQQMAQTAYEFMVRHMYDPSSGMFHWNVTREGQVIQSNKVIYGQWFVLYAFSQYYTAFKVQQARDLALQCFRVMDTAWHSTTYSGYDELPSNQIPPSPEEAHQAQLRSQRAAAARKATSKATEVSSAAAAAGTAAGAAAGAAAEGAGAEGGSSSSSSLMRLYSNTAKALERSVPQQQLKVLLPQRAPGGVEQQERTLNVMMHGLEALTSLHRITQDPLVLQRLFELLDILCTKLERRNGLIFEEYLPQPVGSNRLWTPAAGTVVDYGHNLELVWLVVETQDYLQSIAAIPPQLAQQYRGTVMSIGAAAVRDGYDAQHGGIFESGSPEHGPQSKVKVWWVQAEAMLALWKLHQYYSTGPGMQPAGAAAKLEAPLLAPQHQREQQQVQLLQSAAGAGKGGSNATRGSSSGSSDGGSSSGGRAAGGAAQGTRYLQVLAHTARFVREHVTDEVYGEQFWEVESDGSWQPTNDMDKGSKGGRWKSSYHNSRSVLFLEEWISQQH